MLDVTGFLGRSKKDNTMNNASDKRTHVILTGCMISFEEFMIVQMVRGQFSVHVEVAKKATERLT